MPLIYLPDICLQLENVSRDICIRFPVGNQICVQMPEMGIPDPSELLLSLLGQLNTAMAPLSPLFNVIDAVVSIGDTVKAIPNAVIKFEFEELGESIKRMIEALSKLVELAPPLSLPILLLDCIDIFIRLIDAVIRSLQRLSARLDRITAATTKAAEPGQFMLQATLSCLNANFQLDMQNLNEAFKPINRLIGMINLFLKMIGLPCIPEIGSISGAIDPFIEILLIFIQILQSIRNVIPIPPAGSTSGGVSQEDC